jgi:PAS domain S-box-containing protein
MTDLDHPLLHVPHLWQKVVETMDEALFLVDRSQDVVYFNRRAEQITGFSANEVVGRHCLASFRCTQCVAHCGLFDHERIADRQVDIRRKDGSLITVLKNAVVLRDAAGEVVGGLETFRDISPLKAQIKACGEARGHAEERGQMLAAVLGSIQEGIVALDPKAKVVSVSRRARQMLGIDDEATTLGMACHELLGADLCDASCRLPQDDDPPEGRQQRRVMTVRGRRIELNERVLPLRDDDGRSLGRLLVLTELPTDDLGEGASGFHGLLGRSPAMLAIFKRIQQLSHSEVTVLITGESGTGKELAARALHDTSPRSTGPFLAVSCAALPEGLLESELFGHVKGAFTSAVRDRKGRVELAQGGTLFLDEVGELPLPLQAKLLRLLQERTFERVGEDRTRQADIRVVAATNRDLERAVATGGFRDDLYYRLKVVPLRMPPLRDRSRDVVLLAARLLARHGRDTGRPEMRFTRDATEALLSYRWPGNVRELVNAVEYVVALSATETVDRVELPPEIAGTELEGPSRPPSTDPPEPWSDEPDEARQLRDALARNGWHRIDAAQELGIHRVTLYRLMRQYGITGPRGRRRRRKPD